MSDEKICESCGMPMRGPQDFGGGRPDNKYCVHCTDAGGNLKSYEEVLAGMTVFARQMMGVSEEEAAKFAREGMVKLPAWKDVAQ